jgi:hypothetical protein
MLICSNNECKGENEDGSEFCQHCGEALSIATRHTSIPGVRTRKADGSAQGAVAMIERSVWFRIARGFAWLILVLSLLGLVGGVVYSAPRQYASIFKGEETISASDVKTAIEARRAGASGMEGLEASPVTSIPKAEGQLTTEAIDIFNLLPAGKPESLRRQGAGPSPPGDVGGEHSGWGRQCSSVFLAGDEEGVGGLATAGTARRALKPLSA